MTKLKNKAQLQQISDVAWLVRQGPRKLGILNKDIQEHYFYIIFVKFLLNLLKNDLLSWFFSI